MNHVYRGDWKDQVGRTHVDEGLNISTNMHDVLGNGSVKYVVKVKVGQPELLTDILSQALVSIKIDIGRERYATGRCREIGNEKERGENVRSLVDCYIIREDECAVEPGFEGLQGMRISVSVWRDRRLKLATR